MNPTSLEYLYQITPPVPDRAPTTNRSDGDSTGFDNHLNQAASTVFDVLRSPSRPSSRPSYSSANQPASEIDNADRSESTTRRPTAKPPQKDTSRGDGSSAANSTSGNDKPAAATRDDDRRDDKSDKVDDNEVASVAGAAQAAPKDRRKVGGQNRSRLRRKRCGRGKRQDFRRRSFESSDYRKRREGKRLRGKDNGRSISRCRNARKLVSNAASMPKMQVLQHQTTAGSSARLPNPRHDPARRRPRPWRAILLRLRLRLRIRMCRSLRLRQLQMEIRPMPRRHCRQTPVRINRLHKEQPLQKLPPVRIRTTPTKMRLTWTFPPQRSLLQLRRALRLLLRILLHQTSSVMPRTN